MNTETLQRLLAALREAAARVWLATDSIGLWRGICIFTLPVQQSYGRDRLAAGVDVLRGKRGIVAAAAWRSTQRPDFVGYQNDCQIPTAQSTPWVPPWSPAV